MLEDDLMILSKLAFENCKNELISISDTEIHRKKINTLGLLSSNKYRGSFGKRVTYQFTHLTIQEFLAAKWIHSNFKPDEAGDFVSANISNDRLMYVLLFLAGLSKLDHPAYHTAFSSIKLDLCTFEETADHKVFYTQIQLLYESQKDSICQLLASSITNKVIKVMSSGLSIEISAALAFFIDKSQDTWEVVDITLRHSLFMQFVKGYQATNERTMVKKLILNHQPLLGDFGVCTLSDIDHLLQQHPFLCLDTLSVCSPLGRQKWMDIGDQKSTALEKLVRRLKHLTLHGIVGTSFNIFIPDLSMFLSKSLPMSLESLDIRSEENLFDELRLLMLFGHKEEKDDLKNLSLQVPFMPVPQVDLDNMLGHYLTVNTTLQSLILRYHSTTKYDSGLIITPPRASVCLSNILGGIAKNLNLQRLTLGDVSLNPQSVSFLISFNQTLQILNLMFIELTNDLIIALYAGLKNNKTLVKLCLIDLYNRSIGHRLEGHIMYAFNKLMLNPQPLDETANLEDFHHIPYHLIFAAASTSNLKCLIVDVNPGELAYNCSKFFNEVVQLIFKNSTLSTLTLNYILPEVSLYQTARALVLNGRRCEINLTLATGLRPTYYSRRTGFVRAFREPAEDERRYNIYNRVPVPDLELHIQEEVNSFKHIMLKNMVNTLVFISNTRLLKQKILFERFHFATFLYVILKSLHIRMRKQNIFLQFL